MDVIGEAKRHHRLIWIVLLEQSLNVVGMLEPVRGTRLTQRSASMTALQSSQESVIVFMV